MSSSDRTPLWWDREIDNQTGAALRSDVREAAHRVWRWVRLRTQEVFGDPSDAAEILESSVRAISRYLDKNNVVPNSADPAGLLIVAAYRSLKRLAKKRRRLELLGSVSDLAEVLHIPDWRDDIERTIFLEELAGEFDPKTRGMLRLRMAGYDWKEVGRMLHMTPVAARARFWREVRKAHFRLLRAGKQTRFEVL